MTEQQVGRQTPPETADFVVVGGGILGLAVARELLRRYPDRSLCLLEREDQLGFHQTGHNSGVVHGGIYYKPGSLKARMCVAGARAMYEYCEERDLPFKRNGKVIVALSEAELPRLEELERRGVANGVPGLRRLAPEEIREIEPSVAGIAGLYSPATGVTDFRAVANAMADDVRAAGGNVVTSCPVIRAVPEGGRLRVRHAYGETSAAFGVFAAGAWSDRLAEGAGADADPRIVPFRGAWMRIKPEYRDLVRAHVYPVPDPDLPFLGVHFSRGVTDEVLMGPTALMVAARDAYSLKRVSRRDLRWTLTWPGTYKMARKWWKTGVQEMWHAANVKALVAAGREYIPELTEEHVEPGPAGIRAQAVGRDGALIDDFVVSETENALHVRNAPSPAATASLALAGLIADRIDGRVPWAAANRLEHISTDRSN
ncbi:MAG: L-2-hydroxyglutarate oxidase [Actinomycetota bacterium]|nr:L-2-hydroxyglutarate oxidase [Actinomycetota bacterium]